MKNFYWLLLIFISFALLFLTVFLTVGLLKWDRRREKAKKRYPLTTDLLRGPGEHLRMQIEEVTSKIDDQIFNLILYPLSYVSYVIFLLWASYSTKGTAFLVVGGVVFVIVAILIWQSIGKMRKLVQDRGNLRLGLEGEIAVGQELNQLMRKGAWVFHDLPGPNFNIDHVVVSPAGVFTVETKTRQKPITGSGGEDAKVIYNGKTLKFPDFETSHDLRQAERQAKWLSKELSAAIGEPIFVKPVIAIPGWYIDDTAAPKAKANTNVLVMTPMNRHWLNQLVKTTDGTKLSEQQIERIRYQLDQRCRIKKNDK